MSLTEIIYEALDNLPGARFAGVVGTDGLAVEVAYADDSGPHDLQLAELELGTLIASADAASGRIGSGLVLALALETEDLTYLASLVIPGYFAVLAVPANGTLARARSTMVHMVERISTEL